MKKRHHALLMVDEAHSVGVLGATGGGIGEHFDVDRRDVELWSGTLSKSLASCGGYVAGGRELIQFLKYTTPGFIFSAAMTPPNAAAALAALRQMRSDPEPLDLLRRNAALFLELATEAGIDWRGQCRHADHPVDRRRLDEDADAVERIAAARRERQPDPVPGGAGERGPAALLRDVLPLTRADQAHRQGARRGTGAAPGSSDVDGPVAPAALRLFCFHHAGGGSALFRGWRRALGPHVAVVPVLLPGRERRAGEPRQRPEDAGGRPGRGARRAARAPHAFFGHSMGALVAYRLACRRRAAGAPLPRALFVSAYPAPHLPTPLPPGDGDARALVQLLAGVGGLPPEFLERTHGQEDMLAVVRDDLRLCADWSDGVEPALDCPLHVFGGDADPLVTHGDLLGWQQHSTRTVDPAMLPGGHFYLRDDEQLLRHLRALLRGCLTP